jgi:hypothetical protein
MSTHATENLHSVTETVITLLANLGVDTRLDNHTELVIDRFDHWTSPQNSVLAPSSWPSRADFAAEAAA